MEQETEPHGALLSNDALGMDREQLLQQAKRHHQKEKAALVVMRWYMASVVIFGVAILFCLYRQNTEGAVISTILMIVVCCLGLVLNLPELARRHGRASADLYDLAASMSKNGSREHAEDWTVRIIKIHRNL
ncbi:hypothetical protein [Chromobacterium amazonense]|uniref:hypothetical protein n=1 Tax=Chromobacterium amazonense TaxID=1382803 RepID=UPI0031F66BBB